MMPHEPGIRLGIHAPGPQETGFCSLAGPVEHPFIVRIVDGPVADEHQVAAAFPLEFRGDPTPLTNPGRGSCPEPADHAEDGGDRQPGHQKTAGRVSTPGGSPASKGSRCPRRPVPGSGGG